MHIFIAALMGLGSILWAMKRIIDSGMIQTLADFNPVRLYRALMWRKTTSQKLIDTLDNPVDAGAIIMVQLAQYQGALSEHQLTELKTIMGRVFSVNDGKKEELIAFGRMAVTQSGDVGNALRKVLRPIKEMCTDQEVSEFLASLPEIAALEGRANDHQERLISEALRFFKD